MCGILLFIDDTEKDISTNVKEIECRGTEQYKKLVKKYNNLNLQFHFHRLAIMEPSLESCQPFIYKNIITICNGEVYNFKELIKKYELEPSDNDCSIFAQLYLKVGFVPMLNLLNAEFALILADLNTGYIYIARDPYGIRPLFIGTTLNKNKFSENKIGFGSEGKSLLNLFDSIEFVKPNQYIVVDLSNRLETIVKQWYIYENLLKQPKLNSKELILTKVRETLIKSVDKRLHADRPIGFFLSGGLDSSLIVSIASKLLGNDKLITFSIGLENGQDALMAKKVVDYLGLKHHHNVVFEVNQGINAIPDVIRRTETFDITTIRASTPQYLLAKYVKENTDVKVLLSGEGSDEIHGSYKYFRKAPNEIEFEKETLRLLEELYMFDCLRTDRTVSGFNLEVRVPFLDKEYVELVYQIPYEYKSSNNQLEKSFLREAFEGFLPKEVLWRPKEAFSDAVSNKDVSWYKSIENKIVSENLMVEMPKDEPQIPEAGYYKKIYQQYYGSHKFVKHYWLPRFQDKRIDDPSATILL